MQSESIKDELNHGTNHIRKQLKSHGTQGYNHFGKCIFDIVADKTLGVVYPKPA